MRTLRNISVSLGVITITGRASLFKELLKSIFTGSQLPDEVIIVINGCPNYSIVSNYIKLIKSIRGQTNEPNIKLICLIENAPCWLL